MARPVRRLDVATSDSEALETLRQWWRENGKFAGAGMVLAIAGVGGWKGVEYYRDAHAAEAAEHYVAFVDRLESDYPDSPDNGIPELPSAEYANTPYLAFAYLRRAQYFVERGELPAAINDLRWVADNAVQKVLSELAYVRIARILITLGEVSEALALLDEVVFSDAITPLAEEARGDALMKDNDPESALVAYRAAWQLISVKTDFLRMKLESLGQSVAPPRPPAQ